MKKQGNPMLMTKELPEDVVEQILLWLPVVSLLRFKCVCKSWYALITQQKFIDKHLLHNQSSSEKNKNSHFLVQWSDETTKNYVISRLSYETLQVSLTEPLPLSYFSSELFIVGSCHGLVCLYNNNGSNAVLWNPATKETKVVPNSNLTHVPAGYRAFMNGFGFGFDPKINDYKIIKLLQLSRLDPNSTYFDKEIMFHQSEVYSLSTNSWRKVDNTPCLTTAGLKVLNTKMNVMASWWAIGKDWEGILSFDMSKEVFLTTPLPERSVLRYHSYSRQEFFVFNELVAMANWFRDEESDFCLDIWLLPEFGVNKSWTKLFSVKYFTEVMRPLGFWKNDSVFLERSHRELVLYDLSTNEMTNLHIDGVSNSLHVVTYMESLVSLKRGNELEEQDDS